jgi:hypothetical protein
MEYFFNNGFNVYGVEINSDWEIIEQLKDKILNANKNLSWLQYELNASLCCF